MAWGRAGPRAGTGARSGESRASLRGDPTLSGCDPRCRSPSRVAAGTPSRGYDCCRVLPLDCCHSTAATAPRSSVSARRCVSRGDDGPRGASWSLPSTTGGHRVRSRSRRRSRRESKPSRARVHGPPPGVEGRIPQTPVLANPPPPALTCNAAASFRVYKSTPPDSKLKTIKQFLSCTR